MKQRTLAPYLGWFFIIVVLLPGIVLSAIAFRSISLEGVYIEQGIKRTLLAETSYVSSLIDNRLLQIKQQLDESIDPPALDNLEESFSRWKQSMPLVEVPFLVSAERQILWPRYDEPLSEAEESFLEWNKRFLKDEARIPVFENVALAYKEDILASVPAEAGRSVPSVNQAALQEVTSDRYPGAEDDSSYFKTGAISEEYKSQEALSTFQQSEPLRKQVYEKARQEGQQVLYRNVEVASGLDQEQTVDNRQQESMFISELLNFSQIIAEGEKGIIPRLIDNRLRFLFWKKIAHDYVLGCVMNDDLLKEEIIKVLPQAYTDVRVLTVLDENGRPLIIPRQAKVLDWGKPFAASEISQTLPGWEVAAYLADPALVTSQARMRTLMMWVLVIILYASILSGGVVVLRYVHNEVALAQQKTTFVANVSHELKTPLTSIRMFAEMLKQKPQLESDKKGQYLSLMVSETERLTRLINNVLNFSRGGKPKNNHNLRATDIAVLCADIIEVQRLRLETAGFRVTFTSRCRQCSVAVDEEAFRQVLLNLLENAEKYSPDTKDIELEVEQRGKTLFIRVKDRGIGVRPADAKKIFKEFYRVDDSLTSRVRGTGLGLTIAKRIVEDHGGTIYHQAREGGGSVFVVEFPIKGA